MTEKEKNEFEAKYKEALTRIPKDRLTTPHDCPVCGKHKFLYYNCFEECKVCGWRDDLVQELMPDEDGGANSMSLEEAREAYAKGEKVK